MPYFVRVPHGDRSLSINLATITFVEELKGREARLIVHFDQGQSCELSGEPADNLIAAIDRFQRTTFGHVELPKKGVAYSPGRSD